MKLLTGMTLVLFVPQTLVDGVTKNNTETDVAPQSTNNNQLLEVKLVALEAKLVSGHAALEAKLARQGAYNAALSARVAAQDARATACEKWRSEQEQRDKKILSDIEDLRTNITERSSNVSFLALASSSSQTVPAYAAVKFKNVLHNAAPSGYGYDKIIHRFRCPVNGVYAFHFTATTGTSSSIWYQLGIVKESTTLSVARTYTNGYNVHESMSASAVTPCSKGEYVYVKNLDSSSRTIYTSSGAHFAGFKIY